MQLISEVMTRDVRFVSPQETLEHAAQMMNDLNVGALPVCEGDQLVGMITDRDITVRSTSQGAMPAQGCVQEAMSSEVRWCFEDQPLDEVLQQMADSQIRRVPVISHDEAHRLIGIVALGDLATRTPQQTKPEVEQVVEKVSSPSEPAMPQQAQGSTGAGSSTAEEMGKDMVGAPGSAAAPGAAVGDKDTFGARPSDETTGKGRQGRVGFAGDPGGLASPDAEGTQRATGTDTEGAGSAGAAGSSDTAGGKKGGGTTGTKGSGGGSTTP